MIPNDDTVSVLFGKTGKDGRSCHDHESGCILAGTQTCSSVRAAGDVKFTMWASLFATVVCRTFLSFLLAKWMGMGVIGITVAMVLDWCIKAALDIVRFRSGKWKEKRII